MRGKFNLKPNYYESSNVNKNVYISLIFLYPK